MESPAPEKKAVRHRESYTIVGIGEWAIGAWGLGSELLAPDLGTGLFISAVHVPVIGTYIQWRGR
jgi:hypothetical protein